jgi:DNA-binding TFAR19-related protein (PDSD5 family)
MGGGGGQGPSPEQQEQMRQQQQEAKNSILSQVLDQQARARCRYRAIEFTKFLAMKMSQLYLE